MTAKKYAITAIVIVFIVFVLFGALIGEQIIDAREDRPALLFETQEDYFVDIDGDGDLDYVHFVQFIRQENEEADPYPAPQPGQ